jgi:hypothetical protein
MTWMRRQSLSSSTLLLAACDTADRDVFWARAIGMHEMSSCLPGPRECP